MKFSALQKSFDRPVFIGAGLVTLMATGAVMGDDWPAVMSRMPDNAQVVICSKPLKEFDDHYVQFSAAIEVAQLELMPSPIDALGTFGMNTGAMDLEGSIGIAVMKGGWGEGEDPGVLAFVPVSDYAAWIAALGAEAVADTNFSTIDFDKAMGEESSGEDLWFVRSIENYALMSLDQNLLADYQAGQSNVGKWQGIVGELGTGVVSDCDLTALVDFDGLTNHLKKMVNAGFDEMGGQMGALPPGMGAGADPADLEAMIAAYQRMLGLVIDDMQAAAVGVRFDANGAAFDFSLQWKAGSKMAGLMPGIEGKAENYLNKFDDDPFLFASNLDFAGIKFAELTEFFMGDLPQPMTLNMNQFGKDFWKHVDGAGMVMYPSPAGIMGGLFNGMAMLYDGDGRAIRDDLMKGMLAANEMELPDGVEIKYTFDEASKEIAGVPVDTWRMSMTGPPEMTGQLDEMMKAFYGPTGPGGYIAELETGVVMTMSMNSRLLAAVIESSKKDDGLGRNGAVRGVDGLLSPNPAMTFYVGVGAIVEEVGPMAAMMLPGLELDADVLRTIPPIGTSISVAGGGVQGTLAVPAPTIRFIGSVANNVMELQMGAPGMDGDGDDEPDIF